MEYYYNTNIIDRKPVYRNLMRSDGKGTCYFNWYNGHYYLVDRARGINANFDCFSLVKYIKACDFKNALIHINNDMNLGLAGKNLSSVPGRKRARIKDTSSISKYYKRKVNYKIKCREFDDNDHQYWSRFGINLSTLNFYEVKAVSTYKSDSIESFKFVLKYQHDPLDPCYCYQFKGKKALRVKLYRPLSTSSKWKSNVNSNDIFGINKIADTEDLLFIVSGAKDMMVMKEMGYCSIASQSETQIIKESVIDALKTRFKKIIVLLDNDNAGINSSKAYKTKYKLDYIVLPKIGNEKDVAEFAETYGLESTKIIIKNLINGT